MHIKESVHTPREGFFWIIDDKIVGIKEDVPQYNYQYKLEGKTHENTWKRLYPDSNVGYDYYPRGRVMVDPNYDKDGNFIDYSVMIFTDKCISSQKYKDMIVDEYNLGLKSCNITWFDLLRKAGINHYTCHNCRGE